MTDGIQTTTTRHYSELIDKLPGVMSSSIVFSGDNISEIHILSNTSRAPKQIVRDIQSAIMAQYGVSVDHKLISVAQIPSENEMRMRARLIFEEINVSKNKERTSATVTLSGGDTSFTGTAFAMNDQLEINKMICHATLNAVENFTDKSVHLSVSDAKQFNLGGETAVAVCIAVRSNGKVERLLGGAFVSTDNETAVVKATLDALNRKIAVA
ncbi:MAG: hypothetical protein GX424_04360 [Clostridiales bacterium]|nr:hypothetical protein [Clostridiales bacterium]